MTCWKYCNSRVVVDFAPFRLVSISLPPFCNFSDQFGVRIFFCSSSSSFSCCHPCDTFLSLSLSVFVFLLSFLLYSFLCIHSILAGEFLGCRSDKAVSSPRGLPGSNTDSVRGPSLAAACATFDAPKAPSFRVRLFFVDRIFPPEWGAIRGSQNARN